MIYKVNPHVQWEHVADKENDDVLVYNEESEDVIVVNHTAFKVLERISQNLDVTDIIKQLCKEYNIGRDVVEKDVDDIISQFKESALIIE